MKRRALLIGVNQYHLLGKLSFARQDAEGFAESLCKYCGFTDQDITLMTCQSEGALIPLSRYIEHALMSLADESNVDLLVFGFWGHGFVADSSGRYLCGVDTVETDLERSAISMDVVKAKLTQVQATNTLLVLDCCQNRSVGRSAFADAMSPGEEAQLGAMARDIQAARRQQMENVTSIPTVAILNACREGQRAYEWEARRHGIFTAHLLDGLREGVLSISQLSHMVSSRTAKTTRDIWGQQQTPFITIQGSGDLFLANGTAAATASPSISTPHVIPESRTPVHRYCLECGGRGTETQRILFCTGEVFSVGRANYTTSDGVDLTLRVLPCESATQHPEEWSCNRIIGSRHFAFRVYSGQCQIMAYSEATNPLFVTRVDDVHTRYPAHQVGTQWEQLPRMSRLSIGLSDVLPLECVQLTDAMGHVVGLHILRLTNASHIQYVLLTKRTLTLKVEDGHVKVATEHHDLQITVQDCDVLSLTYTTPVAASAGQLSRTRLPFTLPINGIRIYVRQADVDDFRKP